MKRLLLIPLLALPLVAQPVPTVNVTGTARVGSVYSPELIPGLVGWWSADSGVYEDAGTDLAEDGDGVYQWNNRVPGGSPLCSEDAIRRPKYAVDQCNGLPALRFSATSAYYLTNLWGSQMAQPNTVFLVLYQTNFVADRYMFDGRDTDGTNRHTLIVQTNTFVLKAGGANQVCGASVEDEWVQITAHYDGASSYIRTNGVASATVAGTPGTDSSDGLTVGAAYGLAGGWNGMKLCELLFYDTPPSDAERATIEHYLMSKYGL